MTKQIGMILAAMGIMLLMGSIWVHPSSGGITANVVRESSMGFNDYVVASALGMSITLLMAGFVFYFRVRPGNS